MDLPTKQSIFIHVSVFTLNAMYTAVYPEADVD